MVGVYFLADNLKIYKLIEEVGRYENHGKNERAFAGGCKYACIRGCGSDMGDDIWACLVCLYRCRRFRRDFKNLMFFFVYNATTYDGVVFLCGMMM